MLNVSKYAHYAAVLLECNMIRLCHIVNQLKITFINSLLHDKKKGFCHDIILEQEKLYPGTGIIAEVRQLCEKYNLEDVTKVHLEKSHIKEKVQNYGRVEVWKETLTNNRIPFNHTHLRSVKTYMRLPRYEAKLYFAYKIGELQFKDYRRGEFKRKFGNTKCFADGCSEPDTLEHVRFCTGYDSRYTKTEHETDENVRREFIEYLKRIDAERAKKYYLPVLFRKSLKDVVKRGI